MAKRDFFIGNVKYVFDGDTFEIVVTRVGKNNRNRYNDKEKIHISKLKTTEIVQLVGKRQKPFLERMLIDREVMCLVSSRDPDGLINADVLIM